ncbi:unnamed protein product [Urochloa humidicola]
MSRGAASWHSGWPAAAAMCKFPRALLRLPAGCRAAILFQALHFLADGIDSNVIPALRCLSLTVLFQEM